MAVSVRLGKGKEETLRREDDINNNVGYRGRGGGRGIGGGGHGGKKGNRVGEWSSS